MTLMSEREGEKMLAEDGGHMALFSPCPDQLRNLRGTHRALSAPKCAGGCPGSEPCEQLTASAAALRHKPGICAKCQLIV